jgi:hypothetical protein
LNVGHPRCSFRHRSEVFCHGFDVATFSHHTSQCAVLLSFFLLLLKTAARILQNASNKAHLPSMAAFDCNTTGTFEEDHRITEVATMHKCKSLAHANHALLCSISQFLYNRKC